MVILKRSRALGAGELKTLPLMSNCEAWQGHMNFFFSLSQGRAQPRWVHFPDRARNPPSS